MSTSPPGVKRVVSVLNFFAEHPGQDFTFTEIVRALKLGRATCHALLSGLVEAHYLHRNPDKTYVIGPALVALGRVANEQFSPMQATQPELRKLADQFGALASAIARDGRDVVVLAKAGSGSPLSWVNSPVGERLPLRVPAAASFFAWTPAADVERWLADSQFTVTGEQMDEMNAAIGFAHRHGFIFMSVNTNLPASVDATKLFQSDHRSDFPTVLMADLDAQRNYKLSSLTAPVFDRAGTVAFVLTLSGFDGAEVSGARILEMGEALLEACERITVFISGKRPANLASRLLAPAS